MESLADNGVTLTKLATAINTAHEAALIAATSAVDNAIEVGRLLGEAKAIVPHGAWTDWVQTECNFGVRQAQKYLRIHRERDAILEHIREAGSTAVGINRALASLSPNIEPNQEADPRPPQKRTGGSHLRAPKQPSGGGRNGTQPIEPQEVGANSVSSEVSEGAEIRPPLKPTGKTLVNGVEQEDAEVERMREAGIIPEDATVEVEGSNCEAATVEDLAEEHAERKAIEDEVPDAEWVASLPLSSVLTSLSLSSFQSDALFWRDWQRSHSGDARESRALVRKHLPKPGAVEGEYTRSVRTLVTRPGPEHWLVCPPHNKDGCDGTGHTTLGPCPKCRGRGYHIPYQPPARQPRRR